MRCPECSRAELALRIVGLDRYAWCPSGCGYYNGPIPLLPAWDVAFA